MQLAEAHWRSINDAFTKQSVHFDEDDFTNPILQQWRRQVYSHVARFIKPNSSILELNAGTGIDALHFASMGHTVHATDLSDGMITSIRKKIEHLSLSKQISAQQVSFAHLSQVDGKFDFLFSNFGGLNCLDDLSIVAHELPRLLKEGALVTWVIMPPICFWEWSWILKAQFKKAFRRLTKKSLAHLEGEFFTTYYHSLDDIKKAFGPQFKMVAVEGLGVFSPPPSALEFVKSYPKLSGLLSKLDQITRKYFPFNRCGDHMIVTFQLKQSQS